MKDFALILSSNYPTNERIKSQFYANLAKLGIHPSVCVALTPNDSLLNTLVWLHESKFARLIALVDEESFASLNSALATLHDLSIEISHDEPTVKDAQWLENAISFKAAEREYFIIKSSANFSSELKSALAKELATSGAKAWLLGVDATSAQILLSPAASLNNLELLINEPVDGVCELLLRPREFSDVAGFLDAARSLFDAKFIAYDDLFCALVRECEYAGIKLATAESCTAGMLSGKIASVEGASAVLVGGFCAYSRAAKRSWLNVKALQDAAVYSEVCAQELASGAMSKANANLGVGITGVLGASDDCNVARGTVMICARMDNGAQLIERLQLNDERASMQELASLAAAATCLRLLRGV